MNAHNPIETLAGCMAHAAYEAFPEYKYQDRDWAKHDKWRATLTREEMKTAVAPADCFVEKTRKHTFYDLTVYSMFPQTWSSTALGFGGIGGQAITSAYVCIIESNLVGGYAVYFGGRLAYVINRPNEKFMEDVYRHRMVDAKLGKSTYERTNQTT
jgi:hypothetical protein